MAQKSKFRGTYKALFPHLPLKEIVRKLKACIQWNSFSWVYFSTRRAFDMFHFRTSIPCDIWFLPFPWRTPDSAFLGIDFQGKYYSVADTDWNRDIFRFLAYLFQTTIAEVKGFGIPITIAK